MLIFTTSTTHLVNNKTLDLHSEGAMLSKFIDEGRPTTTKPTFVALPSLTSHSTFYECSRGGVQSALRTTTNQCLASPSGEGTTLPFPIPYPQQSTNSLPLDPLDESTPTFEQFVKSQSGEDEDNPIHMANIDIPDLLGRSFLLPPEDNGERHMAKIIDIDDHGQPLEDIKFKLKINKDQAEEIMSYNQLMDYIQKGTDAEEDPDSLFKFRDIVAHQGPLESTDPDHKGSKYNDMVEWESGEHKIPLTVL